MTDPERELCSSPFVAANFAKAILVEQIMSLIGRSSTNPNAYRRTLYGFELATLRRTLTELTESDFPASQETTDDIHGALRRSGASTPARETLTLQSVLP